MKFFLSLLVLFVCLIPKDIYSVQSVLMKSGKTVKGTILEQNNKELTIRLENGVIETIEKPKILKVVYKELSADEESKIRILEEKKLSETKSIPSTDAIATKQNNTTLEDSSQINNSAINPDSQVFLFTVQGKNCTLFSTQKQWFWLYGNLPLSKVDWSIILPKEKKMIQVRWDTTWKDNLITIFIGTLTSISRKTLEIDICEIDSDSKATDSKTKKK